MVHLIHRQTVHQAARRRRAGSTGMPETSTVARLRAFGSCFGAKRRQCFFVTNARLPEGRAGLTEVLVLVMLHYTIRPPLCVKRSLMQCGG